MNKTALLLLLALLCTLFYSTYSLGMGCNKDRDCWKAFACAKVKLFSGEVYTRCLPHAFVHNAVSAVRAHSNTLSFDGSEDEMTALFAESHWTSQIESLEPVEAEFQESE